MTTPMYFPGPRGGFDEGSLAELAQDGREVHVDVSQPRPRVASDSGPGHAPSSIPINVPEGASALIDGLAGYGS
jgi:hypothetical protein